MTATAFPSDLEIARSVRPRPIADIATDLGIRDDDLKTTPASQDVDGTTRPGLESVLWSAMWPDEVSRQGP